MSPPELPGFLRPRAEGFYAIPFDAYLDPAVPVPRAILTHAHSDHAVPGHGEIWGTPETVAVYRRRHADWAGAAREFPYGAGPDEAGASLRFVPAGHVLGAAQLHFEAPDGRVLFTGDFQRGPSRACALAESPATDVLITETTFGLPVFRFPPREESERRLVEVCRAAIAADKNPILLAYAFGKAQEAAAILTAAGIPTVLHGAAWKLLPDYAAAGYSFPLSRAYEDGPPKAGEALVVPPNCARTAMVKNVKSRAVVYLSGWALREASRSEYDADVLLPLSDHADFRELLEHAEATGARRVLTHHGYARDFARILAARGVDAAALPPLREAAAGTA